MFAAALFEKKRTKYCIIIKTSIIA